MQRLILCISSYTGSDISVLVRDALMQPVRKVLSATHFKKVMAPLKPKEGEPQPDQSILTEYLTPCSPGDAAAMEMGWESVEGKDLLEVSNSCVSHDIASQLADAVVDTQPPLVMNDFMRAIQAVRPTVTEADSEFTRCYLTRQRSLMILLRTTVVKHREFTDEAGVE